MRQARLIAAVFVLITVHFAAADQPPPEEANNNVLFEQGLDAGRKLVVTRGPDHGGSEFGLENGLDGTMRLGPAGKLNVYEVRVEIYAADATPLLLAALIFTKWYAWEPTRIGSMIHPMAR